jgi:hypothetical protein
MADKKFISDNEMAELEKSQSTKPRGFISDDDMAKLEASTTPVDKSVPAWKRPLPLEQQAQINELKKGVEDQYKADLNKEFAFEKGSLSGAGLETAGRQFVNNTTFGLAPKIVGLGKAITESRRGDQSFSEKMDEEAQNYKIASDVAESQQPVAAFVGDVAGLGVGGLGKAATTFGARTATNAGLGAVSGYNSVAPEASLEDKLTAGAAGGVLGAGLGVAAEKLVPAAQTVQKAVTSPLDTMAALANKARQAFNETSLAPEQRRILASMSDDELVRAQEYVKHGKEFTVAAEDAIRDAGINAQVIKDQAARTRALKSADLSQEAAGYRNQATDLKEQKRIADAEFKATARQAADQQAEDISRAAIDASKETQRAASEEYRSVYEPLEQQIIASGERPAAKAIQAIENERINITEDELKRMPKLYGYMDTLEGMQQKLKELPAEDVRGQIEAIEQLKKETYAELGLEANKTPVKASMQRVKKFVDGLIYDSLPEEARDLAKTRASNYAQAMGSKAKTEALAAAGQKFGERGQVADIRKLDSLLNTPDVSADAISQLVGEPISSQQVGLIRNLRKALKSGTRDASEFVNKHLEEISNLPEGLTSTFFNDIESTAKNVGDLQQGLLDLRKQVGDVADRRALLNAGRDAEGRAFQEALERQTTTRAVSNISNRGNTAIERAKRLEDLKLIPKDTTLPGTSPLTGANLPKERLEELRNMAARLSSDKTKEALEKQVTLTGTELPGFQSSGKYGTITGAELAENRGLAGAAADIVRKVPGVRELLLSGSENGVQTAINLRLKLMQHAAKQGLRPAEAAPWAKAGADLLMRNPALIAETLKNAND